MSADEKAVIEAVVHEAAAPFVGVVADLVGICGGDSLKRFRESRRQRQENNERETVAAAAALVDLRKVAPDPNASPEYVEEVLDAAKDCGAAEIRELFARLLAGLADPTRSPFYRREFVGIVSQLEPLEADLLPRLNCTTDFQPNRTDHFVGVLKKSRDELSNAMAHLHKLGLTTSETGFTYTSQPQLTPLGRQLLLIVS